MKLLYAEDERGLSEAVVDVLEYHKYKVEPVYDGQDALDYARNDRYDGIILDVMMPRKSGLEVLRELRAAGVERSVMLSGDRRAAAEAVGRALGLDDVEAELLPQDKVTALEQLLQEQRAGRTLGYVGDGLNDAPVLSRADVGIAMGSLGSDAAIEAADVVIMDDDLRRLPQAIRIARKTLRIVKQNIVFALTVKFLILILGALGLANMWLAVFGDVGVSVIAILNSMRALRD